MKSDHIKLIATNKKARRDYHLSDEIEAGIVLKGTEVKSIREGRVTIKDSYAEIKNGEVFLRQLHINPYTYAFYDNHDPLRSRKLLLHNSEIKRLIVKTKERGFYHHSPETLFQGRKGKGTDRPRQGVRDSMTSARVSRSGMLTGNLTGQ